MMLKEYFSYAFHNQFRINYVKKLVISEHNFLVAIIIIIIINNISMNSEGLGVASVP
jgi:hypothetical protein